MTSISHEPGTVRKPRAEVHLPEMWASFAIIVIWLSVLCATIWGPDIHSSSSGGSDATVPSAVVLALFAFLATWVIVRHGFRRDPRD
ncbi:MAG TPA: hypothetical protein VIA10_18340 [Gaiellaceae bacterium]|jgi:hypothetical protein